MNNQDNIDNLVSFWRAAATPFQAYFKTPDFHYCRLDHSDWPNRLWFDQEPKQDSIEAAFHFISKSEIPLTIPYWDVYQSDSYHELEKKGFKIASEQVGMALKLNQLFPLKNNITIKSVSTPVEEKIWAGIYPESFGYRISRDILANTRKEITYYLIYGETEPIGTAMAYSNNTVYGIHGVGVIPRMRRKGFAEEIMKMLLNQSFNLGYDYACLQASAMGKGLYEKLGFEEQFAMKNYILP
ncbi:GNAT family N-acetyltransferase [Parapedobacter tibetensis]|uniref:GNAT family N-acetyltransferase n=1 Tax=Parapedobacter tibetensis TaxID=2972951 RepID=UPI00214D5ACE|nr:GNAT family N-acetyltransferase [Parapedobacter tibetensis]